MENLRKNIWIQNRFRVLKREFFVELLVFSRNLPYLAKKAVRETHRCLPGGFWTAFFYFASMLFSILHRSCLLFLL